MLNLFDKLLVSSFTDIQIITDIQIFKLLRKVKFEKKLFMKFCDFCSIKIIPVQEKNRKCISQRIGELPAVIAEGKTLR